MKKFSILLGIGIAIAAMQCPSALAGAIGTITYAEGRVDRAASGTQSYFPSVVGEEVSVGDLVRTKSYAKAEITFNDGSVVKLGGSSHIQIQAYEVNDKGSRTQGTIRLDRGKIRAIVQKADDRSPFDVLTPNASGSVKGSDLFVSYLKSATNVLVTEGVFKTINPAFPDRVVEIGAGKSSSIPFNNPPLEPRPYSKAEKKRLETSTGSVLPVSAGDFQNRQQIHAVIAKVSGAVRVQSKDAKEWHAATLNEELFSGDRIETGENGRIEISLDNGHVIELRAHTQLLIKRLSRDPATGTYENYMESEFGRIRAKLQKITPNSNFQIKTPTSVCSVRGTIMYLIISPQATQAFFEGGDGYVTNTMSQVTKTIYAGMSTASDNQGNMTDPTETTGGERNEFDSDWGGDQSGDTEYGYSNSDQGSTGGTGDGNDSGNQGSGGNDTGTGGNNNLGNDVFDLVPPTPNNGGSNPPAINPKELSMELAGSFGNYDSLLGGEGGGGAGSISAVIGAERSNTQWSGLGQATLQGTFSRTEGESLWGSDISGSGNDGGTIQGFAAGTWHSWDTLVANLFIDPAGTAGVILGYLSGTGNAANGVFSGVGALIFAPIEATEILPKDLFNSTLRDPVLYGGLSAAFSDAAGFLDSEYTLERMHLDEAAWGVWRAFYRGSYGNPGEVRQWEGMSGGGLGSENGYAFGEIYGSDNLNGHLSINETSTHLNLSYLTYYSGDITGSYSESTYGGSFFEGAGAGYYQMEPLTFNATVGAGFEETLLPDAGGLYSFMEGGLYGYDGRNEGYLGGTSSPWSGSEPFIGIGLTEMPYPESSFLWNTNFVSGKGLPDEWTTPDDAAVFGLLTGVWKDQMIIGSSVALYRDHEGYLGYLSADFSGLYETGSDAWMIIGAFSPESMTQIADGTPEQFFNAISYEPQISCQLYGSFDGVGSITGGAAGYPYLLDASLVETPFGIFNFTFGMNSNNAYEDKSIASSSWTAVLGGWDVPRYQLFLRSHFRRQLGFRICVGQFRREAFDG
ncbi:MAG: FecR family protein [Candidatus Omnitrophica bacterium]|nr:FecR family protein [Candidatus Omnitrophota bacterium]